MGDDLALARVCDAVTGVEQATRDGDKRIVKVGLYRAIAVCINNLQRRGIGDGEVVWGNTDKRP